MTNIVAIQTVTVGSGGAANIEFTNIPQTYTDLKLVVSARSTHSGIDPVDVRFNSSSTGYTYRSLFGDGSSAASYNGTNPQIQYIPGTGQTANTFNNAELYIPNYASSSNKSFSIDSVEETNGATAYIVPKAALWSNTSAITSITLDPANGNFAQYSTATLYGVTSAAVGAKATGGIINQDTNYYYHTFTSSGTFTPSQSLTCDYLVVAGGGGGGNIIGGSSGAGGGGAGGFRTFTSQSFSATAYAVTVGAGGAANANGSNSSFNSTSATGGGKGGSDSNGSAGGSGGGAGRLGTLTTGGAGNSGSYSPVEGYKGGDANANSAGAGGGGSSSAGVNISSAGVGTSGGNGTASSISGVSVTYAGGGGGGSYIGNTGGTGQAGGGAGGSASNGTAATANSGSGGGGGGASNLSLTFSGGAGGSGIVIVRYAK